MDETLGDVICSRRLSRFDDAGKRRTAVVRLGTPRKRGRSWACPFHITGIGLDEPLFAVGEDAFQAIIMALEGVRVTLKKSSPDWTWIGEQGDAGFPMPILNGFGLEFTRRLEGLVEKETERLGKRAERAYKARSAKR